MYSSLGACNYTWRKKHIRVRVDGEHSTTTNWKALVGLQKIRVVMQDIH